MSTILDKTCLEKCEFCALYVFQSSLSQQHTWRFYMPISANLIVSENCKRFSPLIDADTLADFFRRSRRCGSFETLCDKIAQPDGLTLLAIHSNDRRKSWERAHLANAGEFNRRYLTCQIPGIFRQLRRSAYKIARCVAGFRENTAWRVANLHSPPPPNSNLLL